MTIRVGQSSVWENEKPNGGIQEFLWQAVLLARKAADQLDDSRGVAGVLLGSGSPQSAVPCINALKGPYSVVPDAPTCSQFIEAVEGMAALDCPQRKQGTPLGRSGHNTVVTSQLACERIQTACACTCHVTGRQMRQRSR